MAASDPAPAALPPLSLEGAQWIWTADVPEPARTAPEGRRFLRKAFDLPAGVSITRARVLMTCDNAFTLFINGTCVHDGPVDNSAWKRPLFLELPNAFTHEQNVIAVEVLNTLPGPAGLIAKFDLQGDDGMGRTLVTDASWTGAQTAESGWEAPGFSGDAWQPARVAGPLGIPPWGPVAFDPAATKAAGPVFTVEQETNYDDEMYQHGIVFVRGFLPFKSHDANTFKQNIRNTRAYFECDPPSPAALGRELFSLVPCRPDGTLRRLCSAEGGVLGSPSVSFDGRWVYFSMAPGKDAFFHLYRIAPEGGTPERLTDGPFHDFDPVELPDGRLAFSSTRLGSLEEYHAIEAYCLFSCAPDGSDIQPLTHHIVGDREPRVTTDGALAFIRCDNFLERAKVETHIHRVRSDGGGGQVILGPARSGIAAAPRAAAEANAAWLRQFGAGSPAVRPHGQIAAISQRGLVESSTQTGTRLGPEGYWPYDMRALPDGRLLCTAPGRRGVDVLDPDQGTVRRLFDRTNLALPPGIAGNRSPGYREAALHSVVPLAPRPQPPHRPAAVPPDDTSFSTGYLFCQDVRRTLHPSADLARIRAVRIYEGRPLSLNPTQTIYAHIGTVGAELGTVPLAEDGSFYAEVPAGRPLALQAVDAEGRSVINELSWIYVQPREVRSCVGCHTPAGGVPVPVPAVRMAGQALAYTGHGQPHLFRANNAANGGVLNLQLDRFREAAAINLYKLPRPGDANRAPWPPLEALDLNRLATQARSADAELRLNAIQQLAILRRPAAVDTLTTGLEDPDPRVRCAAALALASCGNRSGLPALATALVDPVPDVARAAHQALVHLTGQEAPGEHGAAWQAWLQQADWTRVEQEVAGRLLDQDPCTVQSAMETLGHLGGPGAAKALRHWMNQHPDGDLRLYMAAMRALGFLRDTEAIPQLAAILEENLTKKEGSGFQETGFLQRPVYLAATAAEALGRIGGDTAESILVDTLPRLSSFEDYTHRSGDHTWLMGCHSSVVHFRFLEAFDALGTVLPPSAIPQLIRSLPMDKDRALLYELDSYEALTTRVIQRSGQTPSVIAACLKVVTGQTTGDDAPLVEAVGASPHAEVHIRKHAPAARAAQVLSVVALHPDIGPSLRMALEQWFQTPASETRSWTCFMLARTLGRLGDREAAPLLRSIVLVEPNEAALGFNPPPTHLLYQGMKPFFRAAAVYALGQLGHPADGELYLALAGDLDNAPAVRRQAAAALGSCHRPDLLPDLDTLIRDYPERTTRRTLRQARILLADTAG